MKAIKYSSTLPQVGVLNLALRVVIFTLVVSAHLAILFVWPKQSNANSVTANELSVNFLMAAQAPQTDIPHPRKPATAPLQLPQKVSELPASAIVEQATVDATPGVAQVAPVMADTEPVYKASYLNNPSPAYPMLARRNGVQGRVVLNVEVLADGLCGQINIHKSSGYAMLDNAALQTVKTWRFLPARQAGQNVDKWFMIPIQFSLKDQAA